MNLNLKIDVVIVGLGYVGLPLAVALSNHYRVLGFDNENRKIEKLKKLDNLDNIDFADISDLKSLKNNIFFTSNLDDIKNADYYIVTVPTPINQALKPDLSHLIDASKIIGQSMKKGSVVIYESTVYPGATEEICIPILEEKSGLVLSKDFGVGYSPERINPGDTEHTLANVNKLISAENSTTLKKVRQLYKKIITAQIIEASSIKVAETSKVIENTQRDLNIGLMNELSMICNKLNIDTMEVINAASSKWNFMPFKPGLVGGHCISVDPYYLTHRAMLEGFSPEIILAGRRVNDNMWKLVIENTLKLMTKSGSEITGAKVGIMGMTFKEDCSDFRNSQVLKIYTELIKYKMTVDIFDPMVDTAEFFEKFGIHLTSWEKMVDLDVLIIAVPHKLFKNITNEEIKNTLNRNGCIIDIKSFLEVSQFNNIPFWKL